MKKKITEFLKRGNLPYGLFLCVLIGVLVWVLRLPLSLGLVAGVSTSATPTPSSYILNIPTDTPVPTLQQLQQAPVQQYQNYGWYTHNGKSMQYVNGNWYDSPQQGATQVPQNTSGQSSYTTEPTVTCVLSYGVYQLTQAECDSAKTADAAEQNQYVHCQTSTGNYLLTPQECATAQQNDTQQPTAIPQQNNNGNLYNQCVSSVQYNYNQKIQSCNVLYSGSAADACTYSYEQQEQQAITNCGVQYPH